MNFYHLFMKPCCLCHQCSITSALFLLATMHAWRSRFCVSNCSSYVIVILLCLNEFTLSLVAGTNYTIDSHNHSHEILVDFNEKYILSWILYWPTYLKFQWRYWFSYFTQTKLAKSWLLMQMNIYLPLTMSKVCTSITTQNNQFLMWFYNKIL